MSNVKSVRLSGRRRAARVREIRDSASRTIFNYNPSLIYYHGLLACKIRTLQIFLGSVCERQRNFLGWGAQLCRPQFYEGNEKKGDQVLFYHSNEGLEIVGIAKVTKEFYQDPTTDEDAWVVVNIAPQKKLKNPVSLAQIKGEKRLANMALVRLSRLSVGPVTPDEFKVVMELAGEK